MFERRLQVLLAVLAVVCGLLVVRAFSLQVVGRTEWTRQAKNALSDEQQVPTVRGRILDMKGRELAVDQPCIDACVHYQAITTTPERKWLNDTARVRVKQRVDNYDELPLAERKTLLTAEVERVKADIETMWHDLAILSKQSEEDLDEQRRQIVRRVETRRRLVWYGKYKSATSQPTDESWMAKMLGSGPAELDSFDVHVSDEHDVHIILPHISYEQRNELARRASRYPGLVLREGVMRVYPYGSLACQTIGRIAKVTPDDLVSDPQRDNTLMKYNPTDDIGREGLEKMLEPQLRGTRGLIAANTDLENLPAATPDAAVAPAATAPVAGSDVKTTIDVDLQAKVEEAFKTVDFVRAAKFGREGIDHLSMPGAAVVIDVASGEIRAMASWPTYDLNQFDDLYPTLVKDQINRPLVNRATLMAVEPGSTVKPIVGIGAISAGVFRADETIHCGGYVVINGRQYTQFGRCWTMRMFHGTHQQVPSGAPHPTGDLTFPDALERSCNVFHEELAYRLGIGGVSFWFDKFGLGKPVGIGLPEASGMKPDTFDGPAGERMVVNCLAGIGESHVAATPIQMANVAATIARNGISIKPTLKKGDTNPPVDLHLNPAAVAEARKGMFNVVNGAAGTGTSIRMDDGLLVSGKTGSAQTGPLRLPQRDAQNNPLKDDRGRVKYDEVTLGTHDRPNPLAPWYRAIGDNEDIRPPHGWMIGYAPADHPKVAFAVLVEFGGGGGTAAGSVIRKLLQSCEDLGYIQKAN